MAGVVALTRAGQKIYRENDAMPKREKQNTATSCRRGGQPGGAGCAEHSATQSADVRS